MITPAKRFVHYSLSIGAMELLPNGRRLKSGRLSPYFFNSGLFNTGCALEVLIDIYTPLCVDIKKPVIFGPAYKGIPLASGIATALWREKGIDAGYAHDRKEVKDHGEGGKLVGCELAGRNVIVVDDVMTTSGSLTNAVEFVRFCNGKARRCIIGFDRQEKGVSSNLSAVQFFEKMTGVPVVTGATLQDLVEVLEEDGGNEYAKGPVVLPLIYAYREQYGV